MPGLALPSISRSGDFGSKARDYEQMAIGAYQGQRPGQKTKMTPPGKTVGGGIAAGAGMATAGYTLGASMASAGLAGSSAGPYGALIGAGFGILSYLLS